MGIKSSVSEQGNELTIQIDGRFDFSAHQEFRRTYEDLDTTPDSYQIDMKGATYLDSSALGMLLLLRDFAGGDSANITIKNSNIDVKKILTISNFQRLFEIE